MVRQAHHDRHALSKMGRFFASLRMTGSEGFAMTHGECQLIYFVHYRFGQTKKLRDLRAKRLLFGTARERAVL